MSVGAVVWLHGLGDQGRSFTFFPQKMSARYTERLTWALPDAPVQPVECNGGMKMRSWFNVADIPIDDEARDYPEDIAASVDRVDDIISSLIEEGIPSEKIVVGGFSQGGAMSLQVALRGKHKLAGCVCLSGWVMMRESIDEWRSDTNKDTPIFWGHGSSDGVVLQQTQDTGTVVLEKLHLAVESKTYAGLQHSLSDGEINDVIAHIAAWLGLEEK